MKCGTPTALIFGLALASPTTAMAQHVDVSPGGVTVGVSRDRDRDRHHHPTADQHSRDHHDDRPEVRIERSGEHRHQVDRGERHHHDASRGDDRR